MDLDQSSPVVDPVLLSSVDVTRPVLRRFELGMSEFVGSDAFEDENRDPTTGKPWRLSLSLQKRPREHDSETESEENVLSAIDYSELFHPYQTMFILSSIKLWFTHNLIRKDRPSIPALIHPRKYHTIIIIL